MKTAHLILNGEIDKKWLKKELKNKSDIFCTDGAYNKIHGLGIFVEAVMGDLDSIDKNFKKHVRTIFLEDQNYTDFEKSLMYLKNKYSEILIYGSLGFDLGHMLNNFSIAKKYSNAIKMEFHDSLQYYFVVNDRSSISLKGVKGKTISIIPFPRVTSATSKGLKYPLKKINMLLGRNTGARNVATMDNVLITISSGCGIMVVQK